VKNNFNNFSLAEPCYLYFSLMFQRKPLFLSASAQPCSLQMLASHTIRSSMAVSNNNLPEALSKSVAPLLPPALRPSLLLQIPEHAIRQMENDMFKDLIQRCSDAQLLNWQILNF